MAGETTRPGAGAGGRDGPPDRRVERGRRTRTQIIEATIDLIEAGNPRPTSRQVAGQAGVSVRLVFHHFRRLAVLMRLAAEVQTARHRDCITMIPPGGPLPARVGAICRQRRTLFEATGPVIRAAQRSEPMSPRLEDLLAGQRALLRRQLATTLRPEIDAYDGGAERLLDVLEHTTGWQFWSSLRLEAGLSAPAAEQAMAATVIELLPRPRRPAGRRKP